MSAAQEEIRKALTEARQAAVRQITDVLLGVDPATADSAFVSAVLEKKDDPATKSLLPDVIAELLKRVNAQPANTISEKKSETPSKIVVPSAAETPPSAAIASA